MRPMQCCSQANLNRTVACRLCPSCQLSKVPSKAAKLADGLVSNGRDRNYWSCQLHKILILIQAHKVTTFNVFYSQPNLTCTRVSHSNPASYSRPREIGQISDLICLFLVDCDRPIVGFILALNSLISIVFLRINARNFAKNQSTCNLPWKMFSFVLLFNIPAFLP